VAVTKQSRRALASAPNYLPDFVAEPAPEPLAGVVVPFEAEPEAAEPLAAEPDAEPAPALSAVLGASANETIAVEVRSEPAIKTVLRSFVMASPMCSRRARFVT
jgi:hypothetical protein